MTEREYLDRRAQRIKARLGRRSDVVNRELETAIGPVVREHPRKSLAVAGMVGVALGAALKPVSGVARGSASGALGFLKNTAVYALRAKLVGSMVTDEPEKDDVG
jgi:ElaB/YqjD/DUF883 family membrane-anchored ribosome-binding protein